MRTKFLKLALLVTLSASALTANAAPTYNFSILGSLGGSSYVYDINNSGEMVGYSTNVNSRYKATLWSPYSPTPFSATELYALSISEKSTSAYRINDFGKIVGGLRYEFTNDRIADKNLLWNSATPNSPITSLLPLSGNNGGVNSKTTGFGINNSGLIVGGSANATGGSFGTLWSPTSPTPYVPTQLQSLGGANANSEPWVINDSGLVAGYSINDSAIKKGALWDVTSPNTAILLESLGGASKIGDVLGMNNFGQIVGYSTDTNDVLKATLWNAISGETLSASGPHLLEALGGASKDSFANGINNSGKIVGYSTDTNDVLKATLWDGTNPPIDLNDYLDQASKNAGWVLVNAIDINNNGWIIGDASNIVLGITSQAFLLQSVNPVPEADTSAMLLMGAGVMGFMARRRKNTQA
jgi:probable HAF family extracellular repeat protein